MEKQYAKLTRSGKSSIIDMEAEPKHGDKVFTRESTISDFSLGQDVKNIIGVIIGEQITKMRI